MNPHQHAIRLHTRRQFLKAGSLGLGAAALTALLEDGSASAQPQAANPLSPKPPHFAPKAKRVIYLHMSGAPPQQELFDHKPKLAALHMKPCPDDWVKGVKFPFIK